LTKPFQIDELLARVDYHLINYFRQKELVEATNLLKQAQKINKIGTFNLNINDQTISFDSGCANLLDRPSEHITLEEFFLLFYNAKSLKLKELFQEVCDFGIPFSQELIYETDSASKSLSLHVEAYIKDEEIINIYGTIQDISDIVKQRNSMSKYVQIVDQNILTSQTDINGIITYASDAFCTISGYRKEELLGVSHNIIRHSETPDELFKQMWTTIKSGKTWKGEYKNKKKNGDFYWVSTTITPDVNYKSEIVGYTAVRTDITNEKKILELSITDQMTMLYNRGHFNEQLPIEIKRSIRNKLTLAFIMLDVDHFKQYNDTYGHQEGDLVLKSIAQALKGVMKRPDDSIYRLGGEEFGIICNISDVPSLELLLKELAKSIEDLHIEHKGNSASKYVTSSFGSILINFNNKDHYEIDADKIYKICDDQLYKAKEAGRNTFKIHHLK
ncbi:MAG: sensor domain-containing diguanylate cyclase, partial [Thiovulaceae bacterium]|nr:sensor domain-containing diguanylate cyclase [Sulfurimonadaceae bacterium]